MNGRLSAAGFLASASFAVLAAALYGYSLGSSSNHEFYLPWVLARLDPSLYPRDAAVKALNGAPTFFWRAMALLSRAVCLDRACWTLWLLSRALAAWIAYRTSLILAPGRIPALLATLFVLMSGSLFISSPLAGDPMFKSCLDQTSLAWPLGLGAVALWLSGRRRAALLALGVLCNINILIGSILAAWLILADLLRGSGLPAAANRALPPFFLGAAPILIFMIGRAWRPDMELVLACIPSTYLAKNWPAEKWLQAAAAFGASLVVYRRHPRAELLKPLLGSALGLWLVAFLAGEFAAWRPLAALQFFRLDVAVLWLTLVASASLLWAGLKDPRLLKCLTALAAAWALSHPFDQTALYAWAGLLMLAGGKRLPSFASGSLAVVYGCVSLYGSSGMFLLGPGTALTAAILGGAIVIAAALKEPPLSSRFVPALALASVLLLLCASALPLVLARGGLPKAESPNALEQWARATPPDTLFIVSPGTAGFRLNSRRSVYAEWTDFNLALWDGAAGRDWKARMAELGVDWASFAQLRAKEERQWQQRVLRGAPGPVAGSFRIWGPEDTPGLARLARKIGAGYIVAPALSRLKLPVAFQAGGLAIYRAI